MDFLFGIATTVFVFVLLVVGAIRDYQTKEVSNWVWGIGLFATPITIFRILFTGLWFIYGIQIVIVFTIVIFGFRAGVLGGADGKAILLISVLYPWLILEPLWLLLAPFVILIGGFILIGVYSLWLLIQNLLIWKQLSKTRERNHSPEKKIFWFTRSLSEQSNQNEKWERVEVPLILYFFIVFMISQIWTILI